jgi:hypothetical protein
MMTTCDAAADRLTPRVSSLPTVKNLLFRWVVGAVHRMYAYKPKERSRSPTPQFRHQHIDFVDFLSSMSHAAPVTLAVYAMNVKRLLTNLHRGKRTGPYISG